MRATWLVAVLIASCSSADYDVVVRFEPPPFPAEVDRVDLFVVHACNALGETGLAPAAPVAHLEIARGSTTALGELPVGSYGFYGRGWSMCDVVTAGCVEREIEPGGSATIVVELSRVDRVPGCASNETCSAGACVRVDGGMVDDGGRADAGPPDAGPLDAGPPDVGPCVPSKELCNGIDDDCDGMVDEVGCSCEVRSTGFGSTYQLCPVALPWLEARDFCQSSAYELVVIDDALENSLVTMFARGVAPGPWWIGLDDRATEGTFVWSNGVVLAPGSFDSWAAGEPDGDDGSADCVEVDVGGAWYDNRCSASRAFVCEAPP